MSISDQRWPIEGQPTLFLYTWTEADFSAVQRLSIQQGWLTPALRPIEALQVWKTLLSRWSRSTVSLNRSLALCVGSTDGMITMFIAELLVDARYRGRKVGKTLLQVCQDLYPRTRLDLISTDEATAFYARVAFVLLVREGAKATYNRDGIFAEEEVVAQYCLSTVERWPIRPGRPRSRGEWE